MRGTVGVHGARSRPDHGPARPVLYGLAATVLLLASSGSGVRASSDRVSLSGLSFAGDGEMQVIGRGTAGTRVRITVSGLGEVVRTVAADGSWSAAGFLPRQGAVHEVAVRDVDGGDDAHDSLRVVVPYARDEGRPVVTSGFAVAVARVATGIEMLFADVFGLRIAQAQGQTGSNRPTDPAGRDDVVGQVRKWLDRADREYREQVVRRLSEGGQRVPAQKPQPGAPPSGPWLPSLGDVRERVGQWLERADKEYRGEVVPRLSGQKAPGVPTAGSDEADLARERAADAEGRRAEEARAEAQRERERRAAAEERVERARRAADEAERRRAEEARAAAVRQRQAAEEERRRTEAEAERARQLRAAAEEQEARARRDADDAERQRAEDARDAAARERQAAEDAERRRADAARAEAERERQLRAAAEEREARARREAEEAERRRAEDARAAATREQQATEEAERRRVAEARAAAAREREVAEARIVEAREREAADRRRRDEAARALAAAQANAERERQRAERAAAEVRRRADESNERRRQGTAASGVDANDPAGEAVPAGRGGSGVSTPAPPVPGRRPDQGQPPQSRLADRALVTSGRAVGGRPVAPGPEAPPRSAYAAVYRGGGREGGQDTKPARHVATTRGCRSAGHFSIGRRVYVVARGDSLWRIARRYYRRGSRYPVIWRANARRIADPNLIYPCQRFRIPRLPRR